MLRRRETCGENGSCDEDDMNGGIGKNQRDVDGHHELYTRTTVPITFPTNDTTSLQ